MPSTVRFKDYISSQIEKTSLNNNDLLFISDSQSSNELKTIKSSEILQSSAFVVTTNLIDPETGTFSIFRSPVQTTLSRVFCLKQGAGSLTIQLIKNGIDNIFTTPVLVSTSDVYVDLGALINNNLNQNDTLSLSLNITGVINNISIQTEFE